VSVNQLLALENRLNSLSPATQPDAWAVAAYRYGVALTESPGRSPAEAHNAAKRALALFDRAAVYLDEARAPVEHGRIVNASGAAWRVLGERDRAIDAFRRAVSLMDGRARSVETGAALSNLGLAMAENGDPRGAIEVFDRSMAVLRPDPLTGNDNERCRAYAAAALNLAQALLATESSLPRYNRNPRGTSVRTGVPHDAPLYRALEHADDVATYQRANAVIADALTVITIESAPMQVGMLHHTGGLIHMKAGAADDAAASFSSSLNVFSRADMPFQHAIARFNRGCAYELKGALRHALIDFESAAQVFDPRLHRAQWLEAATRLAHVEKELTRAKAGAVRHDHIVHFFVDVGPTDQLPLLRERLTRVLGLAPEPQRAEFAQFFAALDRMSEAGDVAASDGVLRSTLEILMELPEDLLRSALVGFLDASTVASQDARERSGRRLDQAIQELVMGPQRVRMRDILYEAGWERP
jgi:tetratricopeptide (TPR) repeat protein